MAPKRVNDLRSRVGDLEARLLQARAMLRQALIDEAGVSVGEIVMDGEGVQYRVVEVDPKDYGLVWVMVNPKRADGTFGNKRRRLFEWSRPDQASAK